MHGSGCVAVVVRKEEKETGEAGLTTRRGGCRVAGFESLPACYKAGGKPAPGYLRRPGGVGMFHKERCGDGGAKSS
jgi:hypothetical protein